MQIVAGIFELVVLTVEVGGRLAQQAGQHLAGLFESVETFLDAAQLDAVGAGFLLIPAGADAQLQPAVGDDVKGGSHIGQYRGVTVVDAGHQGAQPQSSGGLGQRGQRGPALQARAGGVSENRVEVIERPPGFEDVDVVGFLPDGEHLCPGGALRGGFERESHYIHTSRPPETRI
jgi:hypothetical protein